MYEHHLTDNTVLPAPEFTPAAVVALHVDAFRAARDVEGSEASTLDAAVDLAFEFASSTVQGRVGSPETLRRVLDSPPYRPLRSFERAATAPVELSGDHARQEVTLMASDGSEVVYEFRLGRATDGPRRDCWLVDAVDRIA